jgi:hypothetical protein
MTLSMVSSFRMHATSASFHPRFIALLTICMRPAALGGKSQLNVDSLKGIRSEPMPMTPTAFRVVDVV